MKKYSIYIAPHLIEGVKEIYGSQGIGLMSAVDCFLEIRRRNTGWKGVFTRDELTAILASYNGIAMERKYFNLDFFKVHMEDAEKYEQGCTFYDTSVEAIMDKASKMPFLDLFFMHEEIFRFWNVNEAAYEGNLERFIGQWASNE
jgi:hypothetical protein